MTIRVRQLLLFLLLTFSGLLIACQQAPTPPPTATIPPFPTVVSRFDDTEALFNIRANFITYMATDENMTLPAINTWVPRTLTETAAGREYLYEKEDWELIITVPNQVDDGVIYRVSLHGPDNFSYRADFLDNGMTAPAQ